MSQLLINDASQRLATMVKRTPRLSSRYAPRPGASSYTFSGPSRSSSAASFVKDTSVVTLTQAATGLPFPLEAGITSSERKQLTDTADTDAGDPQPSVPLILLDKALELQTPLAARHVSAIRRRHSNESPKRVLRRLNAEFRAATISTGAAVGAVAAAPKVGRRVALALSGGESVAFLNATVLYVLARSEVQGIPIPDIERRRTLVMAIMLGDAGVASVQKVAERTGQHWARKIVAGIPHSQILAINRVLGKNFVTKYGTKQGIVVLGKVIPFGIGIVIGIGANAAISQGVIKAADRAFGKPPTAWPDAGGDGRGVSTDGADLVDSERTFEMDADADDSDWPQ